jgi:excisionase family DNA binding protein
MTRATPGRSNKLHASTGLPALLTIDQVAVATGFSNKTIRRRVSDGTLLAHRIGPRAIRIERDSVLALFAQPIAGPGECGASASTVAAACDTSSSPPQPMGATG